MRIYGFLFLFLGLDFVLLSYGISTLSISLNEAEIYFQNPSFRLFQGLELINFKEINLPFYLTHFSTSLFGQNDFSLRLPFLFFHFLSCILLYILALKYTKNKQDSLLALALFILLPGSVASALLVNEASIVIFLSLAIICAFEYKKMLLFYTLFIISFFIDKSFNILFLTFFFFAIYSKKHFLAMLSLLLFALNFSIYGFDFSGRPKGYFLDTLGIFAACFSPLIFIYFFYVIYKFSFKKGKNLLWFLMSVTFVFCSLLSLRQKIFLEDFLPFCVICTPLLIKTLMQSYRVRLPKYRLKYKIFIECAGIFLLLFYLLIIFNKSLYYALDEPKHHFAYNYHFAKELANELKKQGVNELRVDNSLQKRLEFYGIKDSKIYYLRSIKSSNLADPSKKIIRISFAKFERLYQVLSYEKSL